MNLSPKEINSILKEKLPNLTQKDIKDFFNITTYKKMGKNKIILKIGMQTNIHNGWNPFVRLMPSKLNPAPSETLRAT